MDLLALMVAVTVALTLPELFMGPTIFAVICAYIMVKLFKIEGAHSYVDRKIKENKEKRWKQK